MNSPVLNKRNKILAFEQKMLECPQIYLPVNHIFGGGSYAREMFIPKDTIATGKIHKYEHMNIISKGEITLVTDEYTRRLVAPYIFVSLPGTKKLVYAHEDTVWVTVHATEETDIEKLEAELVTVTYDELPYYDQRKLV